MLVPQIENQFEATEQQTKELPSKTYKYTEERIAGFVDGKEAVMQAAQHILSIERYNYLIYDDNYGVELEQYIRTRSIIY